ncbi:restriction endonuclease [Streptomyces bluensis]|uniref:restriction endonuclease n=1 Tax=Streptomyces bluensis TaxID=33897 RepID=UPI0036CBAC8C
MHDPVIPEVPWETIKGKALESLLFELTEAMGGVDVIWRTGGTGDGAPDGGRDLEAVFLHPTPDGDVEREKWWIEVKGRGGSVESAAVKSAVLNAAGHDDVDVLVVASNSVFTNPTRDWIQTWSRSHKRPKVRLWDRANLDRLVRKYPVTAARVIPEIIQGKERLELLTEQFQEVGRTPLEEDLSYFWKNKHWVTTPEEVACLTYSEVTLGDLNHRPWGTLLGTEEAPSLLVEAIVGLVMTSLRTQVLANSKASQAAAYLIQCSLPNIPPELAHALVNNPFEFLEGEHWEKAAQAIEGYREHVINPCWNISREQLLDACSNDCVRVSVDPGIALGEDPRGPHFWRRLNPEMTLGDDRSLIMEARDKPCAVGFDLTHRSCPLLGSDHADGEEIPLQEVEDLSCVIQYRKKRPDGRFLELSRSLHPKVHESVNKLIEKTVSEDSRE